MDITPELEEATSGVPQGGVLSAILFIIFFSELLNADEFMGLIKHLKFADDLKLYYSYYIENFDPTLLQKAINTISQWCTMNSLSLNATKTVHVQLGPKNSKAKYFVNNIPIIQKDVTRDLGLYIKNDLTLDSHFDNIAAAASGKMFSILRTIITNDPKILIQIFTTYIRPNYEYASPVFNISQKKSIERLEELQKLFTRILYQRNNPHVKYFDVPSYPERLKLYGMMSLQQRRIIADIMIAHDMMVLHPNDRLDLVFVPFITRTEGHYSTKTSINTNKYSDLHFSSRIRPILNKYKINFTNMILPKNFVLIF